jgi:hypothetical protein
MNKLCAGAARTVGNPGQLAQPENCPRQRTFAPQLSPLPDVRQSPSGKAFSGLSPRGLASISYY